MFDNNLPTTIVIFGASGDLTWRKLIPALYNNFKKGRLPENTKIIGFARRPSSDADFRSRLQQGTLSFSPESYEDPVWDSFSTRLHYFQGNLDISDDYTHLDLFLKTLEEGNANRLYYLATAPEHYPLCVGCLGAAGMCAENAGWRRIIIEKPFGVDLESAKSLNRVIHAVFDESQIYRIDHYLGKETAQNLLYFRFANTIFEPIWNRRYVDNVQITVAEDVDVGRRAGYYDTAGVVRDMFQNHIFQLLSLVAMEPPSSFNADAVRNEKIKVLNSIRPILLSDTIRAQYDGYCSLDGVRPNSQTPTFAVIKLFIDNWRWNNVPFYLRSGKSLALKTSEINIEFQRPPHLMFHLKEDSDFTPNILSLSIQPDEGIHLQFEAKLPDSGQEMRSVDMDFLYRTSFNVTLPDAYERLLLEALVGDASLFNRSDGIEASWQLVDPIIQGWEKTGEPPLLTYPPGSWGPPEADQLLEKAGRSWITSCRFDANTIHV